MLSWPGTAEHRVESVQAFADEVSARADQVEEDSACVAEVHDVVCRFAVGGRLMLLSGHRLYAVLCAPVAVTGDDDFFGHHATALRRVGPDLVALPDLPDLAAAFLPIRANSLVTACLSAFRWISARTLTPVL
ncbi:hypothetical protein BGM09_00715 [Streptomyces sp. CBMA29]|nr:hypothetical protein [Streptomyces sp. CBMA29]